MAQRLTREQWEQAALTVLAQRGVAAVAVEPLARQLGVTKGSFYHHFRNRDELLEAALICWEKTSAATTQRVLQRSGDPRLRLAALLRLAFERFDGERSGRLLTHLVSTDHPIVQPVLERVTQYRLDLLTQLLVEGGLAPDDAQERALLVYTAYLGLFQVLATVPGRMPRGAALHRYIDHTLAVLLPEGASSAEERE